MNVGEGTPLLDEDEALREREENHPTSTKLKVQKLLKSVLISGSIILLYIFMKSILPLFNKILFSGFGHPFHYPISCSVVQIFFVSLVLFIMNISIHVVRREYSGIFSPRDVFWKSVRMFPVSIFVALAFILTNIGIDQVNVNIHVLLKTTRILWIILFSVFINERIEIVEILNAALIISGAVLISLDVSLGWSVSSKNYTGVIINLIAPFFDAVMIVFLKRVIIKSVPKETSAAKNAQNIIELTFYQMTIALCIMIIPALIFETGLMKPNFWQAIGDNPVMICVLVLGGLVTMVFHLTQVALTLFEKVLTQGILGELLIFPQLLFYTLLENGDVIPKSWKLGTFRLTVFHIVGGVLVALGSSFTGIHNFITKLKDNKIIKKCSFCGGKKKVTDVDHIDGRRENTIIINANEEDNVEVETKVVDTYGEHFEKGFEKSEKIEGDSSRITE